MLKQLTREFTWFVLYNNTQAWGLYNTALYVKQIQNKTKAVSKNLNGVRVRKSDRGREKDRRVEKEK